MAHLLDKEDAEEELSSDNDDDEYFLSSWFSEVLL